MVHRILLAFDSDRDLDFGLWLVNYVIHSMFV